MNRTNIYHLFLILITIVFGACATAQQTTTVAKKKSDKFLLKKIEKNKIDFDWFGSKAKLKIASEKQKISASASIRMKKDSLIWIKISKAGIQGARMRITPKQIDVLDYQNSKHIRRPFSILKDEYGLEVNFSDLQNLLVGNPIWYQDKKLLAAIEEKRNVLRTSPSEKDILKIFFDSATFLLSEMRGSIGTNAMSILYSDYDKVDKYQVPFRKIIEADSEANGIATIQVIFSKVELDIPQKVGFKIPESYSKE